MVIFFIRTPEKFNMKKRTLTTNLIFAFLVFLTNGSMVGIAGAAGPSFDCSKAAGSIEQMICKDDVLSKMDHKMAEVYAAYPKGSREDDQVFETPWWLTEPREEQ
jgi:uncharacterized protein